MPDTIQSILIGGVAGIISAAVTYFSTRAKIRLDLAAEYDKTLQEERLKVYKELWAMLEPLARYGRDREITYSVLKEISDQTRSWYFKTGGIYLTQLSRDPYFYWKKMMQELLDNKEFKSNPDKTIPDSELKNVISAGSTLRTSLSDDIGTKRLSRL